MVKRPLTDKEKEINVKDIANLKADLDYAQALLKEKSVLIEIAPFKYNEQVRKMNLEKDQLEEVCKINSNAISILLAQNEEGVEMVEEESKEE